MFKCQECGKKFKTVKSAERAVHNGCPKCNGSDIDVDYRRDYRPARQDKDNARKAS